MVALNRLAVSMLASLLPRESLPHSGGDNHDQIPGIRSRRMPKRFPKRMRGRLGEEENRSRNEHGRCAPPLRTGGAWT